MDEDDSQDEQINRSTTFSRRGKRAALWTISDDSDDAEAEPENEQSDSGDEEQDDPVNGDDEDDDDDDDDEDDEEEEEEAKPPDGGGTSADVAGLSSDEDSEKCPICLNSFSEQPVATPENCQHYFCFDCILEWTKNANSCPVDRTTFNCIYIRKCYGGKVKKMVTVQKPAQKSPEDAVDLELEQTNCEVCGGSDREDRLLLCDGCDAGYHMECLTPPLDSVPVEEWFCPECEATNQSSRSSAEDLNQRGSVPPAARPAASRALPTRAIARTQQSERVRANVNRHRISQARSAQLAPTYLMQSTWLDETINAVVAGLNTAVYVRDVAPRAASRRRRTSVKRRKVKRKKTSAAGKTSSTGVPRRKRRSRKTKSKKKLTHRKSANPRSRIASNLGIVKDRNSSSLPTVYRPSESTLSSMRADIGAASLSIYGDPFDLDPFVDQENHEQEAHRRGLSRSALRSHRPVARPVPASLPRGPDVSQTQAASGPDLLGSILSGQSILLMDSSDVIISRDGSLQATKPGLSAGSGMKSSGSSDGGALVSPRSSSREEDPSGCPPEPPCSSTNRPLAHRSTNCPSSTSSRSAPSDLPSRGTPGFLPPAASRSSENSGVDFLAPSQAHAKKAAVKPMWVDVSELPRIPKIRRESRAGPADSRPPGVLEAGMTRPSGDKGGSQREGQQKDGWTRRHSGGAAFSSSFSTSGSSASQPGRPPSSGVSFRISSSGNSWHARKLDIGCSPENLEHVQRRKEDEAKKRLLIRDKRMLLASHALTSRGQESNIYDPCNPTTSDSDSEAESRRLDCRTEGPARGDGEEAGLSIPDVQVKTGKISQEKTGSSQRSTFSDQPPKIKEEPSSAGVKTERLHAAAKLDEAKEASRHSSVNYQDSPTTSVDAARSKPLKGSGSGSASGSGSGSGSRPVASGSASGSALGLQSSVAPNILKPESGRRTGLGTEMKDEPRDVEPRGGAGRLSAHTLPSTSSDQTPQNRRHSGSPSKDSQRKSPSRLASSSSRKKSHESKSSNRNDGRRSGPAPRHRRRGPPNSASSCGSKPEGSKRSESLSTSRERGREHVSLSSEERGGSYFKDWRRTRSRSRSRSGERKEGGSSRSASSSRDAESLQRKVKDLSHKDVQLQDDHQAPVTSCPVQNDCRDSGWEEDIRKNTKPGNNVKKEKQRLNETTRRNPSSSVLNNNNEANIREDPAESSESPRIKSNQSSPNSCPSPPDLLPGATGSQLSSSAKQDVPDVPDVTLDCPEHVKQEDEADSLKDEGGQVSAAVPKTKPQVKRVTWNIQEPEGPQPEKSASKLALYKLKLKQEGVRRSSMMAQTSAQETKGAVTDSPKKEVVGSTPTADAPPSRDPSKQQGESRGEGESLWRTDKVNYLQKLHMQERAIEEVKLAIKPFYQRRDVDKDEYKEILRKAVQKVCHSRSGEINPVKVGNLVKAYVDKYKHARKHRKGAVLGEQTEPITASDNGDSVSPS